jgi:hypothetical protein
MPSALSTTPTLLTCRTCKASSTRRTNAATVKAGYTAGSPQIASVDGVLTAIQSFLKEAFAAAPSRSSSSSNAALDAGAQTQGAPTTPPSHFAPVLAADELARKIGFSSTGAPGPNSPWHTLLWVKALESGGSVTKQSNLFGTKVLFGGGAVDTYSVFAFEGDLVCAGNVYSFQQPVNVKDVQTAVNTPSPTRPRSGCPSTAPAPHWQETNLAVWPRCLDAGLPEGRPQVRNLSSNGKTYDGECGVPCNKLGVAVVDSADLHSG